MGEAGLPWVSERYRNLSIKVDRSVYEYSGETLHGSIVYGIGKELEGPRSEFNDIFRIDDLNRILPEGHYPQKLPGPVEDWALTDSDGKLCIGQSVRKIARTRCLS
ncbi:MAG: hypothetical protein ABEJ07_02745 [Candidatus Nanohaloarchaea archaeon]